MKRAALALALVAGAVSPALAVGLGPLSKSGITDGPAKAFYLTLYNPYKARTAFDVYAIGSADEAPQARVRFPVRSFALRAESGRRFVVIADGLAPGESYAFRVCAEKADDKEEPIHARVCSRITARRIGGGGSGA